MIASEVTSEASEIASVFERRKVEQIAAIDDFRNENTPPMGSLSTGGVPELFDVWCG